MSTLLSKEMLLTRESLKIEKVELGGGQHVFVRQMTGRERDLFEASLMKETRNRQGKTDYEKDLTDFRAKLAVVTICDEKGDLLLGPKDYSLLSQSMSAVKLEKIVKEASLLNAINEDDKEALVKNSFADQSGDSISG